MSRLLLVAAACLVAASCANLEPLTEEALDSARERWETTAPDAYRLTVEMRGGRLETGIFEVTVRGGRVARIEHNGQILLPARGESYSMDGLFDVLAAELALAEQPAALGAPPGYAAHLMARFDPESGGLRRYLRTVGGTANNVEIEVLEYEPYPAE